jgi:hypothetical protein
VLNVVGVCPDNPTALGIEKGYQLSKVEFREATSRCSKPCLFVGLLLEETWIRIDKASFVYRLRLLMGLFLHKLPPQILLFNVVYLPRVKFRYSRVPAYLNTFKLTCLCYKYVFAMYFQVYYFLWI